jgi:hypothetical protein
MKIRKRVPSKWQIAEPMLVPAQWQGSVEHFYHFFLGYFMPVVLWLHKNPAPSIVDGNLKVDQKRQVKSGPPEHYWTGDYCGGLVRDSGFGSP